MHILLRRTNVGLVWSSLLEESRYPALMPPRCGTVMVSVAAMLLVAVQDEFDVCLLSLVAGQKTKAFSLHEILKRTLCHEPTPLLDNSSFAPAKSGNLTNTAGFLRVSGGPDMTNRCGSSYTFLPLVSKYHTFVFTSPQPRKETRKRTLALSMAKLITG